MMQATVRVPATSANLGPGFDSLGLALRLYNFVTVRDRLPGDGAARVLFEKSAASASIPTGETNIAFVAAQFALTKIGADFPPFTLAMQNAIPLSRGLGSSSAARAGALVAANEWACLHGAAPLSPEELLSLCSDLEGHPDNAAAALLGGLTVSAQCENAPASTRSSQRDAHEALKNSANVSALRSTSTRMVPRGTIGEVKNAAHFPSPHGASTRERVPQSALALRAKIETFPAFLAWIPDGELETKTARGALPDTVSRGDAVFNVSRVALLLAALQNARFDLLREALSDRLHENYRAPLMPGFAQVKNAALENGALGVTISGAGSSALIWLLPATASTRKGTESDREERGKVKSAIEAAAKNVGVAGRALALEVDESGCVLV